MASIRVAMRLSLLESHSSPPQHTPKVASGEDRSSQQSVVRSDREKRKLQPVPSSGSPRRNQRRAANVEMSDEENNTAAMESLATLIVDGARIVIVTGAGLSCASGIPAFRSSRSTGKYQDDGTIWGRHVESMGTRAAFLKDPLHWYSSFWLQSFAPGHMKKLPSAGHEALSELTHLSSNISIVTQNVDGLQQQTKLPWEHENRLIEAHGRVGLYRCSNVHDECPYAEEKPITPNSFTPGERTGLGHTDSFQLTQMEKPPKCPHCKSICLPMALLFDEDYTDHVRDVLI